MDAAAPRVDAAAKPTFDAAVRGDGSARRIALDADSQALPTRDEDGGTPADVPLPDAVAATLKRCLITRITKAEETTLEVPSDPSDVHGERASQFAPLSERCVAGGWDLARCAGQTAQVTSVHADGPAAWGPDTRYIAHVIALDNIVCCVTFMEEGSTLTGAPPSAPCGPAYTARAAFQRCNIVEYPGDRAQTVEEVSVPSMLSDDPLWSDRARICRDGKHDLGRCAGKRATLVSTNENTTLEGRANPKMAWILSHEDEVCCIWETDGAEPPELLAKECAAP
jgi:hypothetical protein